MALADSAKAIGAVSNLLVERLTSRTGFHVQVSRPDAASSVNNTNERLNLFLYEAAFDPGLKNVPLDEGQPAPLWMTLRYLMTAYDGDGESDTIGSHERLGEACRALQEVAFLALRDTDGADIRKPLIDNPEDLKITFVDTPSDLISKVMQGTDERYRFSIAFEVRPVMLATGEPSSYNLLVGIDYSQGPPAEIGLDGVRVAVIPSMGATIERIDPEAFDVGDTITVHGSDLHLSGLSVKLGSVELPVTAQNPAWLKCVVRPDLVNGGTISAGGLPVSVLNALPSGRVRRSNTVVGDLRPGLDSVAIVSKTILAATPTEPERAFGELQLDGALLGAADDDTYVALYRDGRTVRVYDVISDVIGPPAQTRRRVVIPSGDPVPTGRYVVLVRVNGVQARNGITIDLVP